MNPNGRSGKRLNVTGDTPTLKGNDAEPRQTLPPLERSYRVRFQLESHFMAKSGSDPDCEKRAIGGLCLKLRGLLIALLIYLQCHGLV